MPRQDSIWKSFGNLIRRRTHAASAPSGNGRYQDHPPPGVAGDVATPEPSVLPSDARSRSSKRPQNPPHALGSLLRWGRRDAKIERLHEGYLRVVDLMDAMHKHFEQHDRRAEQFAESMDGIGGAVRQLANAQTEQGESLRSIAEHARQTGQHAAALSETLGRMPSSFQAQADALRAVARQLEISQESDTQLVHSLQRFEQAVDSLRASGVAQVETLQSIALSQRDQKDSFAALVRGQSRRFLIIIVVAAILGLGALAAMGITLAMVLDR